MKKASKKKTSRKKKSVSTRVSRKASYRDLFERIWDPVFLLDPNSYEIIDANYSAERFTQMELDELRKHTLFDWITQDGHDNAERLLRISRRRYYPRTIELDWLDPKTQRRSRFEFSICSLEIGQSRFALQVIARDITALRNAQAYAMQSAKLAAVGEMAGSIAHEINNPLAIIVSHAENLEEILTPQFEANPYLGKATQSILNTSERISGIIRSLRSLSRDSSEEPFEENSVRRLVEETLNVCRRKFTSRGIKLDIPEIPESLAMDCRGTEISRVLLHLLSNALDAIQSQLPGDEALQAGDQKPWARVLVADKGNEVEIAVENNGPPLAPGIDHQIFQPFFTTQAEQGKSGLGLSIARSIVERHRGKIFLDSRSPYVRFVVKIPKHSKEKIAPTPGLLKVA